MYFVNKTSEEIKELLSSHDTLTFEAKIALQKTILNNHNIEEFNKKLIYELDSSVEREFLRIKKLDYVNNLGFKFTSEDNMMSLRRCNKAKVTDFLGLLFSLVFIVVFALFSAMFYSQFVVNENDMFFTFIFFTGVAMGVIGVTLLIRVINRMISFKGFEVLKDSSNISIKVRPNFKLEHITFPINTRFEIDEREDAISLYVKREKSMITIIEIKKPKFIHAETLKSLAMQLNE